MKFSTFLLAGSMAVVLFWVFVVAPVVLIRYNCNEVWHGAACILRWGGRQMVVHVYHEDIAVPEAPPPMDTMGV